MSLTTPLIAYRGKDRLSLRIASLLLTTILCGAMPAAGQTGLGSPLREHGPSSQFNIKAQTACEAKMLGDVRAREVFSGKAYHELTEIARAYGVPIPHMFVFSGSTNMAYIAGSTAVDGRGKIVVGRQAIEQFDAVALKGFLGHEMAHLVSDRATQRCNDYFLRDPQVEADADALAARTLGIAPVEAFLQRVLTLTQGQNWDARERLKLLQSMLPATASLNSAVPGARSE